jgi:hypothetical protein
MDLSLILTLLKTLPEWGAAVAVIVVVKLFLSSMQHERGKDRETWENHLGRIVELEDQIAHTLAKQSTILELLAQRLLVNQPPSLPPNLDRS